MAKPTVDYFPIRGRGEPIKLALAAKGLDFDVQDVDYPEMKSDLTKYPFAQAPRLVDEDCNVVQSNAILRHLGRKHGMYGSGLREAAAIDMLLDGLEDLNKKYLALIYQDNLADEAKAAYWTAHCDPATVSAARGGAHFKFISLLVGSYGAGFAVGSTLSIADAVLFNMVDLNSRILPDFKTAYPDLAALHDRFAALPGVKAYLEGPLRLPRVNNNNLG